MVQVPTASDTPTQLKVETENNKFSTLKYVWNINRLCLPPVKFKPKIREVILYWLTAYRTSLPHWVTIG